MGVNSLSGVGASFFSQLLSVPVDVVTQRLMVSKGIKKPSSTSPTISSTTSSPTSSQGRMTTLKMIKTIYGERGFIGFYRLSLFFIFSSVL